MIRLLFAAAWFAGCAALAAPRVTNLAGLDTGLGAVEMLKRVEGAPEWFGASAHPWLRIRSIADPRDPANAAKVETELAALARLNELGFKTITLMQWAGGTWPGGVRGGGGRRLALDLREVHARAFAYGKAYGMSTAFEIDNEPDISFVEENPETYAAFLKACYLGFKAGAAEASGDGRPRTAAWRQFLARVKSRFAQPHRAGAPWVVMAPLALPPGPYFEQLVANGFFSYTDAFNYHYYGYAGDFSGMYRQFDDAVAQLGFASDREWSSRKLLPVLITEYGYGSLTDVSRGTREGRVNQWRWFQSVGEQARQLRIEGPMAFYLRPYLERGTAEFGLTTPSVEAAAATHAEPVEGERERTFAAGGIRYVAGDFAEGQKTGAEQEWTKEIGRKVGDEETTPALAWLLAHGAKQPYTARDWVVTAARPSAVVLDFVAGDGLVGLKRYTGYMALTRVGDLQRVGAGEIVLYNFSANPVRGRLELSPAEGLVTKPTDTKRDLTVTLGAGERRVIPLRLSLAAKQFARARWAVRFVPDDDRIAPAVFETAFYPEAGGMTETVVTRFTDAGAGSRQNRELLESRVLATEEVPFRADGRWRVTEGVSVRESETGVWRFSIAAFPNGQPRPSVAELPLNDGFAFPEGGMMRFMYRLAEPAGSTMANGRFCEAYFRTANGNLYQVWPRQYATGEWSEYTEVKENYTMAFYGRTNLPWRFRENRPVALVFWFRPGTAPAAYEVKDARIVRLGNAPAPAGAE